MKTVLNLKHGILPLLILAIGWFMLNIWVVMAGTIYALAGIKLLTQARVPAKFRALNFAAIAGMLCALAVVTKNHDFALAFVAYLLCGGFSPWLKDTALMLIVNVKDCSGKVFNTFLVPSTGDAKKDYAAASARYNELYPRVYECDRCSGGDYHWTQYFEIAKAS